MQKSDDLPNMRRLFKPDPGYVFFDCDLSVADAAVVAWEAEDAELKDAYLRGVKLHIANYELLCEKKFNPDTDKRIKPVGWNYTPYDSMKRFVHATNYGASARTAAITLGWSIAAAESRQRRWFTLHPGIQAWHRRTELNLQTTRTITNRFGYRIVYFERPDALLPEALAWQPQSTIAILCSRGGVRLRRTLGRHLRIRLQAHDALIFQVRKSSLSPQLLCDIHACLHQPIPYPDPLIIPWSIAVSDKSWADCQPADWQTGLPKEATAAA
jgi:DNA polymerase I-like protein with 3'-5' exonuclease and polymerase domains